MELLISLICGAVGGNLGGFILKKFSLGTLWNSVVGIVGGGIGSQLLGGFTSGLGDIGSQIANGGVGGIVLMVIIGLIKMVIKK